jgi:hypothetical protein
MIIKELNILSQAKQSQVLFLVLTIIFSYFFSLNSALSQNEELLEEKTPFWMLPLVSPMSYGAETKVDTRTGNSVSTIRYGGSVVSKNYFQFLRIADLGLGIRKIGDKTDLRTSFTLLHLMGLYDSSEELVLDDGDKQTLPGYWMVGVKLADHDESGFKDYKNTWIGVGVNYTLNQREYHYQDDEYGWEEVNSDGFYLVGLINPYVQWISMEYGEEAFEEIEEIQEEFFRDLEFGIRANFGFRIGNRFRFLLNGEYSSYINYVNLRESKYGCELNYSLVTGKDYYEYNMSGIDFFLKFDMEEYQFSGKTKSIPSLGIGFRFAGFLNTNRWIN